MDFSNLSADTAHRFHAVAEVLSAFDEQEGDTEPSLLDVGGYPGTFVRQFIAEFPAWNGLTIDQPKENLPNYQSGSGTHLPFEEKSFSAVISVDTFEHVPETDRLRFVAELCRVSRHLVVLAAPFHHHSTAAVERLLNDAHKNAFQQPHPWLVDHVQNGLPSLEQTVEQWPAEFHITDARCSYDLMGWTAWQAMSLFQKLRGELDEYWEAFDRAFAKAPTPYITSVPYRYLIVARRGPAGSESIGKVAMPPPEAGTEVVEMARFFCRLFGLLSGSGGGQDPTRMLSAIVDQRLREALMAQEREIASLQARLENRDTSSRQSSLFRLFNREEK